MANPSFQIPDEQLEEFDEVIWQKKKNGELSRKDSRSDVLRMLVEEYIEGNGNSSTTMSPQAAD